MGNHISSKTELGINLTEHFDPKHIYNIVKKRAKIDEYVDRTGIGANETWSDEIYAHTALSQHLRRKGIPLQDLYDQFLDTNYAIVLRYDGIEHLILFGMDIAQGGDVSFRDYGDYLSDSTLCDDKFLKQMGKVRKELLEALELLSKDAEIEKPDLGVRFLVTCRFYC